MEKYSKLMKGLEACAGPDCCGEHCPYYGETRGGKTCRAWLLHDAAAAIANEEAGSETLQELLHNTEAERDRLAAEVDHLEAEKNAYRTEREALREALEKEAEGRRSVEAHLDAIDNDRAEVYQHRNKLIKENEALHNERVTLKNKITNLTDKLEAAEDKTDRPSACDKALMEEVGKLIGQAKYQEGRADALAAIVERCSFGGGCCHE